MTQVILKTSAKLLKNFLPSNFRIDMKWMRPLVASVEMIEPQQITQLQLFHTHIKVEQFCMYEKHILVFWFQGRQHAHNITVAIKKVIIHLIRHNVNNIVKQSFQFCFFFCFSLPMHLAHKISQLSVSCTLPI